MHQVLNLRTISIAAIAVGLCLHVTALTCMGQTGNMLEDRFRKVVSNYEREVRVGLQNDLSAQRIYELRDKRDYQLKEIIHYIDPGKKDHNADELIILAMCFEHLRDWEVAANFAKEAQQKSPTSVGLYAPLVRSLLNLNRTEEAEEIISNSSKHFEATSPIHHLWMPLYIKRSREGCWKHARHHLCTMIESYFDAMETTPLYASIAADQIRYVEETYRRTEADDVGRAHLTKLLSRATAKLAAITKEIGNCAGSESVAVASGYHYLVHELTIACGSDNDVQYVQSLWLKYLVARSSCNVNKDEVLHASRQMIVAINRQREVDSSEVIDAWNTIKSNCDS